VVSYLGARRGGGIGGGVVITGWRGGFVILFLAAVLFLLFGGLWFSKVLAFRRFVVFKSSCVSEVCSFV
jgi:hypothetical protein